MNKSLLLLLLLFYFTSCNFLTMAYSGYGNQRGQSYINPDYQQSYQNNKYNGDDYTKKYISSDYDSTTNNQYGNKYGNDYVKVQKKNNYDSSNYQPTSYDSYTGYNGDNYNNNNNDYKNNDYTPTNNNYQANNYQDYGSSDVSPTSEYGIGSIGTGVMSGSKYSHTHLNIHGKMTGVGHQDYGVHYLSLTKFRKGGGYDIYGKKRQFLDYDTTGHVKKYGNQQMKAKFEVVGKLHGQSSFKDKSSFKPSGGNYGGNGNGGQTY